MRRKEKGAVIPTFQRLLQPLDVHGFPESLAASASLRGSPGTGTLPPTPPTPSPSLAHTPARRRRGGGTEGSRGKRARERDRENEDLPEPLPPALQHGARHVTARTLPAAVLVPGARSKPEPDSACALESGRLGGPVAPVGGGLYPSALVVVLTCLPCSEGRIIKTGEWRQTAWF